MNEQELGQGDRRPPKGNKTDYAEDGPHQLFDPPGVTEALSRMPEPERRQVHPKPDPNSFDVV